MTSYLHYILEKKHKNVFSYLLKLQMEGFFPSFFEYSLCSNKSIHCLHTWYIHFDNHLSFINKKYRCVPRDTLYNMPAN